LRDALLSLGCWSIPTLAVLGVMWLLDTLIKRSQGTTPSQLQRGFEVTKTNPAESQRPAGTESNKTED
jgi:hypothetical protein